jgi:hypothetical protein
MKRTILFTLLFMVAQTLVYSQQCLPEGITFTTQTQIDSFHINYPNCSEIIGDLVINGNGYAINNLENLNQITTIGGGLYIGHSVLIDLSGMDNLSSVGGALALGYNDLLLNLNGLQSLHFVGDYLLIDDNNKLNNLTGLDSLSTLGGYIWIRGNPELTNIYGLNNIDPNTINDLQIRNNNSLSNCDAESICIYLANPNGDIEIHDNNMGCNSQEEVEYACTVGVKETNTESEFMIYPNPAENSLYISSKNGVKIKEVAIFNQHSSIVLHKTNATEYIDISMIDKGLYIIELITDQQRIRKKLIIN